MLPPRPVESSLHLQSILEWVMGLPGIALWGFFAFSNFLENIFPPWPGDSFVIFSGFLSAQNPPPLPLWGVITATLAGNWLGAYVMFRFGGRVLQFLKETDIKVLRNLYEEDSLKRTFGWFSKNSIAIIILSRFSAGVRFFVSIVAGIIKMNFVRFIFLYTIAIFLWCGILLGGGYELGQNWNQIIVILNIYNKFITVLLVMILTGFGVYHYYHKKKNKVDRE
ncbi:DedA family protein [Leptospira ilyithenensis]|nr:DedA family protein [Leptospira ilyithenensis]